MASDPKVYAAGLVQLFSRYPEHLIAEAIDPVNGLPSLHDFVPTLKQVKDFLEPRWKNICRMQEMQERFTRKRLPEPEHNPEKEKYIVDGFQKLSAHLKAHISA